MRIKTWTIKWTCAKLVWNTPTYLKKICALEKTKPPRDFFCDNKKTPKHFQSQHIIMSDKTIASQGLFGQNVNPRERAAHIACAVVLTIVVLAVIVALIVYFTAGPEVFVVANDCSSNDAQVNDNQVKKVAAARQSAPARPAAQKPVVPKAAPKPKPVQRTAADVQANPNGFQSDSGLAQAVTNNSGNTVRQGQGVVSNPLMEGHSENLASFAQNYQNALSSQNPHLARVVDTPNSIHKSYRGDLNNPHLRDSENDSVLLPQAIAQWRKEPRLAFNRSEDYNDVMVNNQNIAMQAVRV